ncbi:YbaB/EbfC family nucleoid-associated protein [Myxococcota bacterium]|nr:YbaB/EbfC family nucleoid-associated protein [Myxococcota bacterium]
MNGLDIGKMMEMAQQMKGQLQDAQAKAAAARVVGEAGGGMVKVVMTGRYQLVEVTLDDTLFGSPDKTLIEDLIRAATNQASQKVEALVKESMGGLTQGMGIDPSAFGL